MSSTALISRQRPGSRDVVKALQRDLRRLGYLETGIDGVFGGMTERAVKALQHDLLHGDGHGPDGDAPVRVCDYDQGRVVAVTGSVDQNLAGCIADMIADDRFPKLPCAVVPRAENALVEVIMETMQPREVPAPFLLAVFEQESDCRHFEVPSAANDDNFIVVGLDRNGPEPHIITSRGYGVSQVTLFHHPPQQAEMDGYIANIEGSIQRGVAALLDKFNGFVNGPTPAAQADDRLHEVGSGPLRRCRYAASDPRCLADCRHCLLDAGRRDIRAGVTPWYEGAGHTFEPTQYHAETFYPGVPIRRNIPCDWPYAVRRYNGSGMNSYHYQAQVLLRVRGTGRS